MPRGRKDIKSTDGRPFTSETAREAGRKSKRVSIRKELRELLAKDGAMVIPSKHVVKVNDDGSVVIKLPKKEQAAMKIVQWAMGSNGTHSMAALKLLIEQIDGKPDQRITIEDEPMTDAEREDEIRRLKQSLYNGEQDQ